MKGRGEEQEEEKKRRRKRRNMLIRLRTEVISSEQLNPSLRPLPNSQVVRQNLPPLLPQQVRNPVSDESVEAFEVQESVREASACWVS